MTADRSSSLTLEPAHASEAEAVWQQYVTCTNALLEKGIRQWDARYPTRAIVSTALEHGDLFALRRGDELIGSVILNDVQPPEYSGVPWQLPGPVLVIHTLVIDPRAQGGGAGHQAVVLSEQHGRAKGCVTVRLDAYPGNEAAMRLYRRRGYQERGFVRFAIKPPGCEQYAVFEKSLRDST